VDEYRRSDAEPQDRPNIAERLPHNLTKSDLQAHEEANKFLESRATDRKHRQLITKKVAYTPDPGIKSRSLIKAFRRLGNSTKNL
jgi:hypothetical protein